VASHAKMPGTEVPEIDSVEAQGAPSRARSAKVGYLPVSELVADRAGGPSPFGDDLVFPLPVEELTYTATTAP
jgi:hypothetical protein